MILHRATLEMAGCRDIRTASFLLPLTQLCLLVMIRAWRRRQGIMAVGSPGLPFIYLNAFSRTCVRDPSVSMKKSGPSLLAFMVTAFLPTNVSEIKAHIVAEVANFEKGQMRLRLEYGPPRVPITWSTCLDNIFLLSWPFLGMELIEILTYTSTRRMAYNYLH